MKMSVNLIDDDHAWINRKQFLSLNRVNKMIRHRNDSINESDAIPVEWIQEQIREQTFDSKVLSRMLRVWRAKQNEKRSPDLS